MRILHRNGIPFFQHLTVSWSLRFARIFFSTVNKKVLCIIKVLEKQSLYSCGFTNLLYESFKCHEATFFETIKSALQRKGIAYLVGNKNDRFSYQSSYKIIVGSVLLCCCAIFKSFKPPFKFPEAFYYPIVRMIRCAI